MSRKRKRSRGHYRAVKKELKRGRTLPGYKYCGPGNSLDLGLPTNVIDNACLRHDRGYQALIEAGKNPYEEKLNVADLILIDDLEEQLKKRELPAGQRVAGSLVKAIFQHKRESIKAGKLVGAVPEVPSSEVAGSKSDTQSKIIWKKTKTRQRVDPEEKKEETVMSYPLVRMDEDVKYNTTLGGYVRGGGSLGYRKRRRRSRKKSYKKNKRLASMFKKLKREIALNYTTWQDDRTYDTGRVTASANAMNDYGIGFNSKTKLEALLVAPRHLVYETTYQYIANDLADNDNVQAVMEYKVLMLLKMRNNWGCDIQVHAGLYMCQDNVTLATGFAVDEIHSWVDDYYGSNAGKETSMLFGKKFIPNKTAHFKRIRYYYRKMEPGDEWTLDYKRHAHFSAQKADTASAEQQAYHSHYWYIKIVGGLVHDDTNNQNVGRESAQIDWEARTFYKYRVGGTAVKRGVLSTSNVDTITDGVQIDASGGGEVPST